MGRVPKDRAPASLARAALRPAAALLGLLALAACAPRDGPDQGQTPKVVLLLDGATTPEADARENLPAFVVLRFVYEGKSSYADRVAAALPGSAGGGTASAVVAMAPRKGFSDFARRARSAGGSARWILVSPADDALLAEGSADLVVDVDPDQGRGSDFDRALERGLCELARRAATGKARVDDAAEVAGALRSAGGFEWKVAYRVDPETGVKARNHVIVSAKPR